MIETTTRHARARRVSLLWFALVVLSLNPMMGCAGSDEKNDNNTPTPTQPSAATPTRPPGTVTPSPTAPVQDLALAACQKLAGCGQCFMNERGTCLAPEQCATRLTEDEARCINSAAGCNAIALGDCLTVGCGGDGSGDCE